MKQFDFNLLFRCFAGLDIGFAVYLRAH